MRPLDTAVNSKEEVQQEAPALDQKKVRKEEKQAAKKAKQEEKKAEKAAKKTAKEKTIDNEFFIEDTKAKPATTEKREDGVTQKDNTTKNPERRQRSNQVANTVTVAQASAHEVNGTYEQRDAVEVPAGFRLLSHTQGWDDEQMWKAKTDGVRPWFETSTGSFIFWNRPKRQWWINGPMGEGVLPTLVCCLSASLPVNRSHLRLVVAELYMCPSEKMLPYAETHHYVRAGHHHTSHWEALKTYAELTLPMVHIHAVHRQLLRRTAVVAKEHGEGTPAAMLILEAQKRQEALLVDRRKLERESAKDIEAANKSAQRAEAAADSGGLLALLGV